MAPDQTKRQQPGADGMLNNPGWYQALTLTERLAMDGVNEVELLVLLCEGAEIGWVRLVEPPAWLQELSQAFERPTAAADLAEVAELCASLDEGEEERSDGQCLPDVLATSSLRALSEADLAWQSWFIEVALSTMPMEETIGFGGSHLVPDAPPATPERLIRAACAVGDRLGSLALPSSHGGKLAGRDVRA